MKKLLLLSLLLMCFQGFSQEKVQKVYQHTNGVQNIQHSQEIVTNKATNTTTVHNVRNGVREITPVSTVQTETKLMPNLKPKPKKGGGN